MEVRDRTVRTKHDHHSPRSTEPSATSENSPATAVHCGRQPPTNIATTTTTSTNKSKDIVAALNEVGIANLYAGDAMVAQESFIIALSSCNNSYLQKRGDHMNLTDTSTTTTDSGTPGTPNTSLGVAFRGGLTTASHLSLDANDTVTHSVPTQPTGTGTGNNTNSTHAAAATATATAEQQANVNMHVYQREEYDEGMHMFKEALYLDDCETSTLFRDATLMYNVGQTHLRTRQYEDAKRWFGLSLTTLMEYKENQSPSVITPSSDTYPSCAGTDHDDHDDDNDHEDGSMATQRKPILNEVKIIHNIAFCCYCLGHNDLATLHYQSALRYAQGDFDMAACCNSIGILHLCAGDSTKAMECLQLALNIYRRLLGSKAVPVATCLSNIARVFFTRQEFATALVLFQESLQIRQQQAQEDTTSHSPVDEAAAMFNIGQTYQKLGKTPEALRHFMAFRELAEPVLGSRHRDIATCIKAMACIHYETGNIDRACELLEEAVQSSHAVAPSFELVCLLRDMGCLYSMTNQTDKALERHLETLRLQRLLYGADHWKNPNIMVTLLHIAQNYKKLSKYTKALQVYRGVYDIQLELFGPKSLEVAATLCSIGLMLYLKQDLKSSLNYYQEALRVRQEHFKTDDNFDIAATFNSIGLIAFKMKKLQLAKVAFLSCIRIRIKLEATDCHKDIVTLYSNLGTVYLASGEDKEAIQKFTESIRLERKILGDNNLAVAVSLQHLAQLHQDRGELEMAHEYFAEALAITKEADEATMTNKQRTVCTLLNLMGNIHLMKAEVPQMMECFVEASRVQIDDSSDTTNGNSGADQFGNLVIAGYTFYGISKMHPPCSPVA